jgi:Recombination endonuclease VII
MGEKTFSEMLETDVGDDGVSIPQAFYRLINSQDDAIGQFRSNHVLPSSRLLKKGVLPVNLSSVEAVTARTAAKACAICGLLFTQGKDKHLDHDHVTGTFRGFLCRRCNTALGYFEKFLRDSALSIKMWNYIKK